MWGSFRRPKPFNKPLLYILKRNHPTVDCVDGKYASVDPLPDGAGDQVVDGHGPVQVVPDPEEVGGVHPVSLPSPPAVIVTVLTARSRVEVYQCSQAQLLHPDQRSPQVEEGTGRVRGVHVGDGEGFVQLDVPVPVA